MAKRPAWSFRDNRVVQAVFEFEWNAGLSVSQKQKNVAALHAAIEQRFHETALEVSSKSLTELGRALSAFTLPLDGTCLECVYQSSKVFTNGGPYRDLLAVSPREARHDPRLRASGPITGFAYAGYQWPLQPTSAFYDYLYSKAVLQNFSAAQLRALDEYAWFTDIEFNPQKSLSTQARSVALLKAVLADGAQKALEDPRIWIAYHKQVARFA